MYKYAFIGLFLCVALCCARNLTYGELAKELAKKYDDSLDEELPILTVNSVPTEVKKLRKAILFLRDSLDVFAYAYPSDNEDKWREIRKTLDSGYSFVGNFQDLRFSNHTPDEERKLLEICLAWKRNWTEKSVSNYYKLYILYPETNRLVEREKKELFGFYWKRLPKTPTLELDGLQNVAMLEHDLIQLERENLETVTKIESVLDLADHEIFHNFRKTLRSIEYLATFMQPDRTIYVEDVSDLLKENRVVYDGFGDINDQITNYNHEKDNGASKSKLKELEAEIDMNWGKIKKYIKDNDFDANLKKLKNLLIDY